MSQDLAAWPIPLPDCVRVERKGAIAVLRLNRPEKRNALSDELVLGLQAFFSTIPSDVQGVVMCGAGDNFCAGLDLNELKETDAAESFDTCIIGQRLNEAVQFCRVPVIAVLHGAVIGGGLELAASADIRIAEQSAYYALPEGTRGIFSVARTTWSSLAARTSSRRRSRATSIETPTCSRPPCSAYPIRSGSSGSSPLKPGVRVTGDELIRRLRGQLAPYKCPKAIFFTSTLTKSSVGKVLRKELRKQYGPAG